MTQKKGLREQFKTNTKFESEGVDFVISDTEKIRIRRHGGTNSVKIAQAQAKFSKPYIGRIKSQEMTQSDITKIVAKVFVECSVIGWEGITEENGTPMEFNFDNAVKLMCELPDLLNTLMVYAENMENFKDAPEVDNSELGNS